jgi:serine/threonine-protein kinase
MALPPDPAQVGDAPTPAPPERVGRYTLHGEIASGGMAVVHYGMLAGAAGFARLVAIKRILPGLSRDDSVRAMFANEARLTARIRHPNIVSVLDVVSQGRELFIVMEYVHGESLHGLLRTSRARGHRVPLSIVLAIASAVLHGLHAAHEATTETGQPLGIVHRDVSPQNIMLGIDGAARVLDFGVARAAMRSENTAIGVVKGKLAYMAPEQLGGTPLDRRADVYATGVILWEMLTGRRLFMQQDGTIAMVERLLAAAAPPPSHFAPDTPRLLDAIVLHELARDPAQRFATAREMAVALERAGDLALPSEVSAWVESLATDALAERARQLSTIERTSSSMTLAARSTMPTLPAPADDPSERTTFRPPRRTLDVPAVAVCTPHPSMALSIRAAQVAPRRSAVAVFFTYALLLAGAVLTFAFGRAALQLSAGTTPAPACDSDMVRIAGLCLEAKEFLAAGPAAAAEACRLRGRRLPTAAERAAASLPPFPSAPAGGSGAEPFRCVASW